MSKNDKFTKPKYIEIVKISKNGGIIEAPLSEYEKRGITDEAFIKAAERNIELYKKDLKYLENR